MVLLLFAHLCPGKISATPPSPLERAEAESKMITAHNNNRSMNDCNDGEYYTIKTVLPERLFHIFRWLSSAEAEYNSSRVFGEW